VSAAPTREWSAAAANTTTTVAIATTAVGD